MARLSSWGAHVRRAFDEKLFLPLAYRLVLRRTLDPAGAAFYTTVLKTREMSRPVVVSALRASDEHIAAVARRHAVARCRIGFVHQCARLAIFGPRSELLMNATFRAFLGREPDADGRRNWTTRRARRLLRLRDAHIWATESTEFARRHGLRPDPRIALHEARVGMAMAWLPAADVILDLGGAAPGRPEGALLWLGYPHVPRTVIVVDLPPDERFWPGHESANTERPHEYRTTDGIVVRYVYRMMWDLGWVADRSVDLVVSGESIEHVTAERAATTLREAYRVLKPGGIICLDTPNAGITRLQMPEGFIHAEHKHEYRVDEMRDLLAEIGFEIVRMRGIRAVPAIRASGVFDIDELVTGPTYSDEPEDGYLFYIEARRPA